MKSSLKNEKKNARLPQRDIFLNWKKKKASLIYNPLPPHPKAQTNQVSTQLLKEHIHRVRQMPGFTLEKFEFSRCGGRRLGICISKNLPL